MNEPIRATWCLSNNFGDALNVYLIKKMTGQSPLYVDRDLIVSKYVVCGSILNWAVEHTTVWGAGIANKDDTINANVVDVGAVRGPISAERLSVCTGTSVSVYGDPAMVLPRYYQPEVEKKYEVGIVPHYLHQVEVAARYQKTEGVKIINVFDDIESYIRQVCECKVILSSSLHGLIIADAYGIPNLWFEGSVALGGDRTKFYDHFKAVGKQCYQPLSIHSLDLQDLVYPVAQTVNVDKLLSVCPFHQDKKLSILICSLADRKEKLNSLVQTLERQTTPAVEILIETDSGQMTVGAKRNLLLKKASGDYVCFIDEDDGVPSDYIVKILRAIATKPDVIGILGLLFHGDTRKEFVHNIDCKSWHERDGKYYRTPNHLNPVKRELAIQVGFPDKSFGEDKDYSDRLFPLLKTEVMIDGFMYNYYPNKKAV